MIFTDVGSLFCSSASNSVPSISGRRMSMRNTSKKAVFALVKASWAVVAVSVMYPSSCKIFEKTRSISVSSSIMSTRYERWVIDTNP